MRILVVDDDYVSRVKLSELLVPYGHRDAAPNGDIAIRLFDEAHKELAPYDLVTMDIGMPGMGGQEVVACLREKEKSWGMARESAAKIIMVTGRDSVKDVWSSYFEGCDGYLTKPIKPESLKKALAQAGCKLEDDRA
jgi:two-component system, chemotaxis family, chemotaxis protein CheY